MYKINLAQSCIFYDCDCLLFYCRYFQCLISTVHEYREMSPSCYSLHEAQNSGEPGHCRGNIPRCKYISSQPGHCSALLQADRQLSTRLTLSCSEAWARALGSLHTGVQSPLTGPRRHRSCTGDQETQGGSGDIEGIRRHRRNQQAPAWTRGGRWV